MTKFLNNADVKGYISQTDVTSSLLKTDSSGKLVAAVAGTDYQTPTALASADRMVTVGRNATGATLYKGTIVYISGSTGNRPNFVKAQANSEATSAGTFGVVYADIANNSDGNVVNIGVIDTLDTRASAPNPFTSDLLVDGDTLYLSPDTAGYVTKTKPSAPNHLVYIGKVTRTSPTNGTVVYRIQNGYELDEIHNVAIASIANNQTIVWESATNLWKNKTIAAALGYTPADDSSVVKLTGDQTVAGVKTFSSVINASTLSLNGGVLSGNNIVSMRSNPTGGQFRIEKSDGSLSAYPFYIGVDGTALAYYYNAAGALKVLLHTNDTSYFGNSLSVGYSTYASTSYMLDVNGTVRLTGALSGTSATFSSAVTIGNYDGQALKFQAATSTGSSYLRFYNSAAASRGYLGLFWNGTSDYMVLDAGALEMNFGSSNKFTFTGGGAATFSSSVTATQLYSASSTHGYLNLTAVNTGGNEAGIFFNINGNKWEQYIAANDLAMNWYSYSAATIVMKLSQAGQLKLSTYTSATSFSGTAAGYLAFDSSGNVITVAGVAATDNTKLPFNGVSTRFNGDLNTLGLSGTTGVYNLGGTLTNSPSTYGTLYAIWNSDISTQFYVSYNGSAYWRQSVGATYAGSSWKTFLDSSNYNSYALALSGGTMTGPLVVSAADRGFEVNASGGISLYSNEINAGALGGTGTIYLGWRRTTQVNVGVPMVLSSSISATSASLSGILSMATSGTSYIRMGSFPQSTSNSGEAWLGRAADRSAGSMTVQLGGSSNSSFFEIVDYAWTTVTFKAGMNDFSYKGNAILHAGNYNSYSPTLTGGGASGTWGINVTGNANNITQYTINQSLGTGNGPTFQDVYVNGWFRNNTNNTGLYSQANNIHFYANSTGYWNTSAGGRASGAIKFMQDHETTLKGYVYWDGSGFGLLNNQGGWSVLCYQGASYGGELRGSWTMAGNTIWTSSNAARAGNSNLMYYQGFTLDANTMDSNATGFTYSNNAPFTGPIARFSTGGGYDMWLGGNYGGGGNVFYIRTRNGDAAAMNPWRLLITDGNYSSYALPLSGGTVTGIANFGPDSGADNGIGIRYGNTGYGRIRFYNDGNNHSTIHSFGTSWAGGASVGMINLDGQNGVTMGPWNAPHLTVTSSGLRIGSTSSSNIWMTDSDETTRRIHCNSNRIGFLNSSDGWGAWCYNDGGWESSGRVRGSDLYSGGWVYSINNCGWYNDSYSQGLRPAAPNSYFGTVATYGTNSNGYGGYTIMNNYRVILMQNSSGDFGFYNNDDWKWNLFYNRGNDCWGIGTDNTYSGDGFRCIKYGSAQYGWTTWSDRRAKENISTITGALDKVLNMRGVYFNYIIDEEKTKRVGFIAQELQEILPEAVRYAEEIDEYNVEYSQIVSVLTEAIKEQNIKIQSLEAQLQTLLN